jgi:cobalt-zinc-cadmium efflux system outer membrane protein
MNRTIQIRFQAVFSVGLGLGGLWGCAKVEPGADFQRADQLITERTGSPSVYDPQAECLIQERIDELLADGLTIDEAVQVALLNNRGLQSAFQEIGVSRADVVQAGLLSNPTFSMLIKPPAGGGRPDSEFSIAQQLVDLWQIPVRKKIAKAQLEATVLGVAHRGITLAFDVRVRALELLALQRGEDALHENLKLVQQSLQLAQRQFEAGAVSQLDVNLARGTVIDVQLELIALRRELEVARTNLALLLNLSENKTWSLRDTLPEPAPVAAQGLLALALQQRLDARVAESKVRAAEGDLRQEYLKIFPNIEAGFDLEVLESRALPGRQIPADTARASIANGMLTAPSIQTRGERAIERRQIINEILGPSLALTVPIFDQNQAQIAKARYRVIQRRKDYEDLLDKIANEVDQASEVARTVRSLVSYYNEQALPQAQTGIEGAQRLYEAGQQGIAVLIDAQEMLTTRRRAYVRALGDYAVAMAELERAVGGRLYPALATQPAATQPASSLAE